MKKTIRDYDLYGKKIIMRVDFNVPIKDGVITDDNRIKESLPTIKYALEKGAKLILLSHLGKVKTEEDKVKNSLKPVAIRLGELLNQDIIFSPTTRSLEALVNGMENGQVLLVENTRYEDIPAKAESSNDRSLAGYWASLGDIFINDAFGSCHRAHASVAGIASILPNGIGFLVEKELKELTKVINIEERPFTVIMGGAKIEDKIGVIENLVKKSDHILVGTAMAFTFFKAMGYNIGKSLIDEDSIDFCKDMLENYKDKLVLPIDVYVVQELGGTPKVVAIDNIGSDEMGVDVGPKTSELFAEFLKESKTIFWNGPVGIFENELYQDGTLSICKLLRTVDAIKIAGGGDTASAINKFGFKEAFTHISTGGGASLELIEGKELPGISIINSK